MPDVDEFYTRLGTLIRDETPYGAVTDAPDLIGPDRFEVEDRSISTNSKKVLGKFGANKNATRTSPAFPESDVDVYEWKIGQESYRITKVIRARYQFRRTVKERQADGTVLDVQKTVSAFLLIGYNGNGEP